MVNHQIAYSYRGRFPPWKSFKNNRPPHSTEYFHSNLNHLYSNISVNSAGFWKNKFLYIWDPQRARAAPGGGGMVPPLPLQADQGRGSCDYSIKIQLFAKQDFSE